MSKMDTGDGTRLSELDESASPRRQSDSYELDGVKPTARRYWRCTRKRRMEQLDRRGPVCDYTKTGRWPHAQDAIWMKCRAYRFKTFGLTFRPINSEAAERLGYPTQKPLALLERIIQASSNPGDVVLDPFCGCGTAVAAAQKLDRRWIGIDITHLAISLQKYRLAAMFPGLKFEVIGEPEDLGAARQLAEDDRYQFQWWALSLVRAKPLGGQEGSKAGKKGSDKGVDGVITFIDDNTGKPKRVLVQVKSGHVNAGDVRDLHRHGGAGEGRAGRLHHPGAAHRADADRGRHRGLLPLARLEPGLPPHPDSDDREPAEGRAGPDAADRADLQAGAEGGAGQAGRSIESWRVSRSGRYTRGCGSSGRRDADSRHARRGLERQALYR